MQGTYRRHAHEKNQKVPVPPSSHLVVLFFLALFITIGANARTLTVDDDPGAEYGSIRDALDDAKDGDTIRVYEGTYYENIHISRSVNLIGNSSSDTTIDGGDFSDVVRLNADSVNLSGFTITNSGNGGNNAGIYILTGKHEIFHCNISDNNIGIYMSFCQENLFRDNEIYNNTKSGIGITYSENNTILQNNISGNGNYGIHLEDQNYNNTILNNTLKENGHTGINLYNNCDGNRIEYNTASSHNWFGIQLNRDCHDNTVLNNTCDGNYHGIRVYRTDNNSFVGNTCVGNEEYGIHLEEADSCVLSGNSIRNNGEYGIYIESSNRNDLINNTCQNNTIYNIYIDTSHNNLLINNTCNLGIIGFIVRSSNNNTLFGNHGNDHTQHGAYIYLSSRDNVVVNSTFLNNGKVGISLNSVENISIEGTTSMFNDYGVYLTETDEIAINNCELSYNRIGVRIAAEGNGIQIHHNNIQDNMEYGIDNGENDGSNLSAYENWWGDPTGPNHTLRNPGGQGDNVSNNVDLIPWLDRPFDYFTPEAFIDDIRPFRALEGEKITFLGHGIAYNTITSYVWTANTFDELHNDSSPSFVFDGLPNGTSTVTFRIMDGFGNWSEEVSTTIYVNGKPGIRSTSISPDPALQGENVSFSADAFDDDAIMRYLWWSDINGVLYNGTVSTFITSTLENGTHIIFVRVQDSDGIWSTDTNATLIVNGIPTAAIVGISPDPGLEDQMIQFTGTGKDDGSITEYTWTSSIDGILFQGQDPSFSHSNLSNGTHSISLIVIDNQGILSIPAYSSIRINGIPRAEIVSIDPDPCVEDHSIHFQAKGTDDGIVDRYL